MSILVEPHAGELAALALAKSEAVKCTLVLMQKLCHVGEK